MFKPIIGITMGDAAGIGPEIIVKTLALPQIYETCRPLVIGDAHTIIAESRTESLEINAVDSIDRCLFDYGTIDVFKVRGIDLSGVKQGQVSRKAGKAAVEFLLEAIRIALRQEIHAIVTAPLNKEAINLAGYHYQGHTEILAAKTHTLKYAMMLAAGALKVIHVTTHVALRDACELITKTKILDTILLAHSALHALGFQQPRIAVAGLNPHAGESGLFGTEEVDHIRPAVQYAQEKGIKVEGPLPPDTVFLKALQGHYDVVVAMYHDQGHIPLKLVGFEKGVNVTLGLPVIRTSVDHGTAFDIAGQGKASPDSLIEAIKLAIEFATKKFTQA
jgi:4-hydroxythreonine-4-phosphate dehydrogenase